MVELAPALTALNPVLVPLPIGEGGMAGARRHGGLDAPPPRPRALCPPRH
jgi:hypothetical protein